MTIQTSNKTIYWVLGILFVIIVLFGGYKFWHDSQPATTDNTSIHTTGMNSRQDTSGSGTQQSDQSNISNHNPMQEIQKHLGL